MVDLGRANEHGGRQHGMALAFGADATTLAGAWPGTRAAAPLDCTMMADAATGATVVREGDCDAQVTPASTFKIAISLMGFDSGVLRDAHTPYLSYKASYASRNVSWRHGTDPAAWLRESIVWSRDAFVAELAERAL